MIPAKPIVKTERRSFALRPDDFHSCGMEGPPKNIDGLRSY